MELFEYSGVGTRREVRKFTDKTEKQETDKGGPYRP